MNNLLSDFERDGYVILEQGIPIEQVDAMEDAVQATAAHLSAISGLNVDGLSIFDTLQHMERSDRKAFYDLCTFAGMSSAGFQIATSPKIVEAMSIISGQPGGRYHPTNPALLCNDRQVTRLQYMWHQESTYQIFFKRAFHLWTPLFADLTDADGPMVVCKGSHQKSFEYTTHRAAESVVNLAIDEAELTAYEKVLCSFRRGDVILFHHSLVHATGPNTTDRIRVALNVRYFDVLAEQPFRPILTFAPLVEDVISDEKTDG